MQYLSDKNILLISPESWGHLFISKHNYAVELSRHGNNVFFLNPPSFSFSCLPTLYPNVWEVNYPKFVKGLRFFPSLLIKRFFKNRLSQIEKLINKKIDIVWSFDNSVFFDFSFLPEKVLSISHIVDYSQNFQFAKAAKTADICFAISRNILEKLKAFNSKSYSISHGYMQSDSRIDVSMPGDAKIKALYAGNLSSKYLDEDLIFRLSDYHKNVDFIFLGTGRFTRRPNENMHFIGSVNQSLLPSYFAKADVLLVLYNYDKAPDQITNSHKLLEYLGSGKPVVSTYLSDYEGTELMCMVRSNNDFLDAFANVIGNLKHHNNPELVGKRRRFASANTYGAKVKEIDNILSAHFLIP